MRICISETREVYELSLRVWCDDINRYSPDYLQDLEIDFPAEHFRLVGTDVILAPLSHFLVLVEYWSNHKSPEQSLSIDYAYTAPDDWEV